MHFEREIELGGFVMIIGWKWLICEVGLKESEEMLDKCEKAPVLIP